MQQGAGKLEPEGMHWDNQFAGPYRVPLLFIVLLGVESFTQCLLNIWPRSKRELISNKLVTTFYLSVKPGLDLLFLPCKKYVVCC